MRVRADRLISLMLLLRNRGRMSASALAAELEVSTRTVLRDIDALSGAGIPVYARRGREGGYALLPGFRTDLTGLTHDEAFALLATGTRAPDAAGVAPALASAMRKIVAGMPEAQRVSASRAAERILIRSDSWCGLRPDDEAADDERQRTVRAAVFAGRRLRIRYATPGEAPRWRTVDPIGLVSARGVWYLLADRDGAERTYRMSRVVEARELPEPAVREASVDLARMWERRRERHHATLPTLTATVRVRARRRPDLLSAGGHVQAESPDQGGWLRLTIGYGDLSHAVSAIWRVSPDAEALAPAALRTALRKAATATAARYTS